MTVEDFIVAARSWLGVPYRHQGRSKLGVDCIGFPIALLREWRLLPPGFKDEHAYGRRPDGKMLPIVETYCENLPRPEPGCLVLLQWPKMKSPGHAAVSTGSTLIHSYQRAGGVVENGYRGPWVRCYHSAWRLPGVSAVE